MSVKHSQLAPGPFRADQIPEGSYYELSNGHAVLCMPSGRRGGRSNLLGGGVLETDPAVVSAGVDVGFSPEPSHLRAPDVSVGDFANEPGFAPGAPPLAVEYADTGQDVADLKLKIAELLSAGTQIVWVVRLTGPRRVEVHEAGKAMRVARPGEDLLAPGILQNPVPVLALYDRDAAHEATLRNLLQRRGYESLDAVFAAGETHGIEQGIEKGIEKGRQGALLAVLRARSLPLPRDVSDRIAGTSDLALLDTWIERAATASTLDEVLIERDDRPRPRKRKR